MKVVCPGSFDPVTYGHLDIFQRAQNLFDEVIIAVGTNTAKNPLFDVPTRVRLLQAATDGLPGVSVQPFSGLLANFCRDQDAKAIVKGLRFGGDFDYELQQAHINEAIGEIETVFLPAGRQYGTISSTMVREIATLGGDISQFVPLPVIAEINKMKEL